MKRMEPMRLSIHYAILVVALLVFAPLLLAQSQGTSVSSSTLASPASSSTGEPPFPVPSPSAVASPTLYNPYPPGILPADLNQELARVLGEVNVIEAEAMATAQALPTPVIVGQPPTIQGSGYLAIQTLGKLLNYDINMSPFRNVACASCHMPYAAFSGPIPSVNLTMISYPGTFHFRAGKRTAQRYTYSPHFPVFQLNTTLSGVAGAKKAATFFGGNFWDGRATGYKLQSADAQQSQGPPVDTQEMGFPDTACIAFRLQTAAYRELFEQIWGEGSLDINFPSQTEAICDTPGGAAIFGTNAEPVELSPDDRTKSNNVYDHWAQSLSFYEASPNVSPFTSKFDAFLAGKATLTPDEMAGYNLFKGRGNCNSCHLDGRSTAPTPPPPDGTLPNSTDTGAAASTQPLFTCFGYANLGLPINAADAFYYQTTPDFFGFTPNPFGFGFRDLGVGTFLRSGFGSAPNPNSAFTQFAPTSDGQMQTSTARNVALTPPQCPTTEAPGPFFQKEFFHNGYIKSLKQLVHFYNTRDVFPFPVTSGHCPSGTVEKVNCWPMAEVPNNIDMTVGKLGLSDTEENQIVTFLGTLSDGFTTPFPDINTFTGSCMMGGTAATQGNQFIVPVPSPLPTCAAAICAVAPTPGPSPIP